MLFLNPIGSIMDRKFGPKLGLSVGMIILTLCIFLLTISTNMWAFIILISIGFGIPTGFAYVPAISCCWRLFPKQKGLISGIILCGFGMGSFIFSYIAKEIVNPYNEAPVSINGQFIYPEAVANRVK
jgi:MFS family permease